MEGKLLRPEVKSEGSGAKVRRLFPSTDLEHYDPFVLLDEFFVDPEAGFPRHRHAGFEAVTYIIEGGFKHKDNLGNDSSIGEGGVQRFTAGKGIEHSEMPVGEKQSHGFQLWINLPKELKETEPSYQKVTAEKIPVKHEGKTKIKTIIGEDSPVKTNTPVLYQDVLLEEACFTSVEFPENYRGFLYVHEGEIMIDFMDKEKEKISNDQAYFPKEENRISIRCNARSRFIVISGKPIKEKIRLQGSVVK
ncbi:MAG: pirin family protein [Candidatus Thermoplasmatota archaeon]|nr:pirin family protein [Candidatus Thermoplasmatota archaeon]MBS3790194.1 pirin family protein [Candidatus Thermoplasmatota archaeon]